MTTVVYITTPCRTISFLKNPCRMMGVVRAYSPILWRQRQEKHKLNAT